VLEGACSEDEGSMPPPPSTASSRDWRWKLGPRRPWRFRRWNHKRLAIFSFFFFFLANPFEREKVPWWHLRHPGILNHPLGTRGLVFSQSWSWYFKEGNFPLLIAALEISCNMQE
jgi:hypothetical protein